jgi:calcineurin-like phosphoesterase family protein
MARILYTSDLHIGHPYVAKLRGFTKIDDRNLIGTPDGSPEIIGDFQAHDDVILQNINKEVKNDDILFILGDFALNWKYAGEFLAKMNGRKILIWGNHDIMFGGFRDAHKYMRYWVGDRKFESIQAFARRKVGDKEFLMSHFPYQGDHPELKDRYTQYRLRDEGMWLLHGHTHSSIVHDDAHPRQIHVGVDAWGLKPVHEEAVIELMKAKDLDAASAVGV